MTANGSPTPATRRPAPATQADLVLGGSVTRRVDGLIGGVQSSPMLDLTSVRADLSNRRDRAGRPWSCARQTGRSRAHATPVMTAAFPGQSAEASASPCCAVPPRWRAIRDGRALPCRPSTAHTGRARHLAKPPEMPAANGQLRAAVGGCGSGQSFTVPVRTRPQSTRTRSALTTPAMAPRTRRPARGRYSGHRVDVRGHRFTCTAHNRARRRRATPHEAAVASSRAAVDARKADDQADSAK